VIQRTIPRARHNWLCAEPGGSEHFGVRTAAVGVAGVRWLPDPEPGLPRRSTTQPADDRRSDRWRLAVGGHDQRPGYTLGRYRSSAARGRWLSAGTIGSAGLK